MKLKGLILLAMAAVTTPVFAMDAACQFVQTTVGRVEQIINMSGSSRDAQACALIKATADVNYIGSQWLGDYANSGDTAGINQFYKLVPSILVTKIEKQAGGKSASGATVTVNPTATDRGNGVYGVDVTIQTSSNSYNGTAVVTNAGGGWRLMDIEYMGFSGVSYMSSDIQNTLSGASSVSDADQQIESASGFIRCP